MQSPPTLPPAPPGLPPPIPPESTNQAIQKLTRENELLKKSLQAISENADLIITSLQKDKQDCLQKTACICQLLVTRCHRLEHMLSSQKGLDSNYSLFPYDEVIQCANNPASTWPPPIRSSELSSAISELSKQPPSLIQQPTPPSVPFSFGAASAISVVPPPSLPSSSSLTAINVLQPASTPVYAFSSPLHPLPPSGLPDIAPSIPTLPLASVSQSDDSISLQRKRKRVAFAEHLSIHRKISGNDIGDKMIPELNSEFSTYSSDDFVIDDGIEKDDRIRSNRSAIADKNSLHEEDCREPEELEKEASVEGSEDGEAREDDFSSSIFKIAQSKAPGNSISSKAVRVLNAFLQATMDKIVIEATQIRGDNSVLEGQFVLAAIRRVLPTHMADEVISKLFEVGGGGDDDDGDDGENDLDDDDEFDEDLEETK